MEWTLEVIVVPVTDVDRARDFYRDQVGFTVDHDVVVSDQLRIVQLTPPGSACSIVLGTGVGDAPAGSVRGLQLVVSDIEAARAELVARGVQVTEVQRLDPRDGGAFVHFRDPDGNGWAVQEIRARAGTPAAEPPIGTLAAAAALGSAEVIAFAATRNLSAAQEFYAGTLGLALVEQSEFACVFDVNGTMLRVTAVPDMTPAGYTVLGWRVVDAAATVRSLSLRGVRFTRFEGMHQDELGIWLTPGGDQVAWFTDPDGNTLSLTQFA